MAIINSPPAEAVSTMSEDDPGIGWRSFFISVYNICNAVTQSGTTAQRPTTLLWTGRIYFDTTLGLPIFYKTSSWVKADGTAA